MIVSSDVDGLGAVGTARLISGAVGARDVEVGAENLVEPGNARPAVAEDAGLAHRLGDLLRQRRQLLYQWSYLLHQRANRLRRCAVRLCIRWRCRC